MCVRTEYKQVTIDACIFFFSRFLDDDVCVHGYIRPKDVLASDITKGFSRKFQRQIGSRSRLLLLLLSAVNAFVQVCARVIAYATMSVKAGCRWIKGHFFPLPFLGRIIAWCLSISMHGSKFQLTTNSCAWYRREDKLAGDWDAYVRLHFSYLRYYSKLSWILEECFRFRSSRWINIHSLWFKI